MTVQTIPDITPNGAATPLSATSLLAAWVNAAASGTSIRFGDSHVGSARGVPLPTNVVVAVAVRCDFDQQPYDLSQLYVYGASGTDKVSITYGS